MAATISVAIRTTATAIIQLRPFFSRTSGAVPLRTCRNLSGTFRVAQFLSVEIDDVDTHIMLHFAFAQVVQMGTPLAILFKIVGHMLGEKNVSGVSAIHHSLRQVDSSARYIRTVVHVGNTAHRSAVDSHAHPQLRVASQRIAHLQRTGNRCVRRGRKNQGHPSLRDF